MFIVFEGIDGSGKSTQAKLLFNALRQNGYDAYLTFEPTDSLIGSLIRNIFSHRLEADQHTIAALFAADRLDHILNPVNGLLKQIRDGKIVICDRYFYSSYAYHGVHVDMNWVIDMNKKAAAFLKPDHTFYIDVPPKVSMQRITSNRSNVELYETLSNLQKVYDKYGEALELLRESYPVTIIDGLQEIHTIQDMISNIIFNRVNSDALSS
jgi:dTMP kinase